MQPSFADTVSFFGIFLIGLGLNLTPCIYPMLSITVSLFGAQTGASRFQVFLRAFVYVLGMAVIYSALGTATAFTGSFFGAVLQSKWMLLAIAVLFLVLAGGMFDSYVFQAPSGLMNLAQRKSAGFAGLFLSGMFVGVFAAPCIGPLIIALLTHVGSKGDPIYAFRVFFTMSLGLGAPYLVLGTFAGLIPKLPKSGVWLAWVKKLFGTVLVAFSAFYFLLALAPDYLKWLLPAALVLGGIYLGFLEKSGTSSPGFVQFKKSAGILAVILGILIPLFAPRESVQWEIYSQEKLAQATKEARPVILDFYADWCLPCHELDRFTYSDPRVIAALEGFTRLKVDLTEADAEAPAALIEQYEVLGVPTILFLDPAGNEPEDSRVTGFISADELLRLLDEIGLKKPVS